MDQQDHNSNEDMSQFLKDLKTKDSGYRLPNDYFAKMQASVLDQVIEQETVKEMVFVDNLKAWFQLLLKPQYALIGIVAMILIGVFVGNNGSTDNLNSFANLEDQDLEYYIENEIDDLELMAAISEDELNDMNFPVSINDAIIVPDQYIEDLDDIILEDLLIEH